jgi:hypothetical protein
VRFAESPTDTFFECLGVAEELLRCGPRRGTCPEVWCAQNGVLVMRESARGGCSVSGQLSIGAKV